MVACTGLRRTTTASLSLICAVTIALSAAVYLNMIGTIEEDAKAAFKGQFSPGIAYFQSFLQSNAAGLRGMADAISAMPTFPSHDAFQRVSPPLDRMRMPFIVWFWVVVSGRVEEPIALSRRQRAWRVVLGNLGGLSCYR